MPNHASMLLAVAFQLCSILCQLVLATSAVFYLVLMNAAGEGVCSEGPLLVLETPSSVACENESARRIDKATRQSQTRQRH